jgi:YVTN family beta-propeller protein
MKHFHRVAALALATSAAFSSAASAQSLELARRGTFATNAVGGSEIVAHDPATQRLFVTNGAANRIDVVNIANVDAPVLAFSINIDALGGIVNSVAVKNGLVAAAIANSNPTTPGVVAVFGTDGALRRIFGAGVLPDNVSFSPNGNFLLAANEGEPVGTFGQPSFVDPRGSVTLIDLTPGIDKAVPVQIDFTGFDGRENELRARGVRIFPNRSAGRDLEPEFVAVSPDNTRAFVTLQENNAFAVIDLATRSVLDIVPAGLKNHSRGLPLVDTFNFPTLPLLATTPAGQNILLGGFSGLWFEGVDGPTGRLRFVTVPDRGPNGEPTNTDADAALERPFVLPDYQPRVVRFTFDPVTSAIELGATILLTRADGSTPLTGLPNIAGVDEEPVDLNGVPLAYDPFGADIEGVVIAPNGDYWMVDEYRPAIYRFSPAGALLARYVPIGTGALGGQPAGTYGTETLPAEYSTRRANRGFEGMALDSDSGILYAFIQTPLANPNLAASNASKVIRMVGINPDNGAVIAEYVYLMDKTPFREAGQNPDKIGDAAYAGNGTFYIVERDDSVQRSGKKMLFQFTLAGATNLRAAGAPPLLPGLTLEQHTPDQLATAGIRAVPKIKTANLPSIGYFEGDKLEGVAWLGNGQLALLNDNDFGVAPLPIPRDGTVPLDAEPTPVQLGFVRFVQPAGLDASDRDGPANGQAINIANWPVYGMHMPDSIASFSAGGSTFYTSAGEGDDRGEVARIGSGSITLDETVFPNRVALRTNAQLGRLNASTIDGNLDGDAEFERLQVLGSRSFIVWDQFGNLVFDSGDILEQVTALRFPLNFNADNEVNDFDTRSDNKGPEPEAIAVGRTPDGRTYAFVGLERIGGVAVFNVTDPYAVRYSNYINNRDFSVTINLVMDPDAAGDLGPEGIVFIAAGDSPTGAPLIAVANEISGTTTLFGIASDVVFQDGFE